MLNRRLKIALGLLLGALIAAYGAFSAAKELGDQALAVWASASVAQAAFFAFLTLVLRSQISGFFRAMRDLRRPSFLAVAGWLILTLTFLANLILFVSTVARAPVLGSSGNLVGMLLLIFAAAVGGGLLSAAGLDRLAPVFPKAVEIEKSVRAERERFAEAVRRQDLEVMRDPAKARLDRLFNHPRLK